MLKVIRQAGWVFNEYDKKQKQSICSINFAILLFINYNIILKKATLGYQKEQVGLFFKAYMWPKAS